MTNAELIARLRNGGMGVSDLYAHCRIAADALAQAEQERDAARHQAAVWGCRDVAQHDEESCSLCQATHALLDAVNERDAALDALKQTGARLDALQDAWVAVTRERDTARAALGQAREALYAPTKFPGERMILHAEAHRILTAALEELGEGE